MPDIEQLGLQITSDVGNSVQAIDKLTASLSKLNGALGKYTGNDSYLKTLNSIASGFGNIALSVDKIDTQKLKSTTSAINNVSRAMKELSKTDSSVDVSVSTDSVDKMSAIMREFGIEGEKSVGNVKNAFDILKIAIENGYDKADAITAVMETIKQEAKFDISEEMGLVKASRMAENIYEMIQAAKKTGLNLQGFFDGQPLEAQRSARATFGKQSVMDGKAGSSLQGLDSFVEQMQEMGAISQNISYGEAVTQILELFKAVDKSKNAFLRWNEAVRAGKTDSDFLKKKIFELANAFENEKTAINDVNKANQQSGSNGSLSRIANELRSFEGLALPNAEQFALFGKAISQIGSASGGASSITAIATELKNIGSIDLRGVDVNGISNLANAIKKLSNATKASGNLRGVQIALKDFATLKAVPNTAWITPFAQSISRLGGKTAQQAITTLPKLGKAIQQVIKDLQSVGSVNQSVIRLIGNITGLVNATRKVQPTSTRASKGLDIFHRSANRATKSSFSLASAIGKIYASYWLLFRFFGKLGQSINLASQLKEVQNVVDTTFGEMTEKIEELSKTSIQTLGMSELSVKQFASRFQAMGTAMGISNSQIVGMSSNLKRLGIDYVETTGSMADMSIGLTKLTADIASFYDVEQAEVAEDLQAIFTGMTRPLTLAA